MAEHIEGIDRHLMAPLSTSDRTALDVVRSKLLSAGGEGK